MRPVLSIVYPAFRLSPDQISNLHVHHLTVNMHPYRTLSAPVTEIVVVSRRADRVYTSERAWERCVDMCVAQLKAGLYAVDGAYPPLLWGEIKQMPGKYLMLVGWDGVEVGFCIISTIVVVEPLEMGWLVGAYHADHFDADRASLLFFV